MNLLFPNLGFCIISFFIHFINIEYLLGVWHWEYRDEKDSLYSQGAQFLGKKKKTTTGIIIINPLLEMYKKGLGGHRGGSE